MLPFDGKLSIASFEKIHRDLDVGTGTGIWAINFDEWPSRREYGTDSCGGRTSWSKGAVTFLMKRFKLTISGHWGWFESLTTIIVSSFGEVKLRWRNSVPPNLVFEIGNLEEDWNFSKKFDYIHSMKMTGAFQDWQRFYRQSFEYVSPSSVSRVI